ncbi:SagB/ThcOx family dehydrogenase [Candidatus Thorarchaeota archaeon]|nr:MAG: SagB/ThcOx family dehydrogenase [Candidatus Thorarchaeota archaeon]
MSENVSLPAPRTKGSDSLEEALMARRTIRSVTEEKLTLEQISQLLWATYGTTTTGKRFERRTVPSAGHQFPLVVYVLVADAFYRYNPLKHVLVAMKQGDYRSALRRMRLYEPNRQALSKAPIVVVITVDTERAIRSSPLLESVLKFSYLEAGHATQNLSLQAAVLELGLTTITSFDIQGVFGALRLPKNHCPIYLIPIGHPVS